MEESMQRHSGRMTTLHLVELERKKSRRTKKQKELTLQKIKGIGVAKNKEIGVAKNKRN